MTPILFPSTATTFTGAGICPLLDAISCRVTEDNNGTFVLEMEYPSTGRFFDEIKINRIIYAKPSMTQDAQPFDIKSVTIGENGVATFYANHVYYRLKNYICAPKCWDSSTSTILLSSIMSNSLWTQAQSGWHMRTPGISAPFTPHVYGGSSGVYRFVRCPISAYKFLQDYLIGASTELDSKYVKPIEVKFDGFNIDVNFTDDGYSRGQLRPMVLRVGTNVNSMTYEIDYSDCVSWIMPFWAKTTEDDDGKVTQDVVLLTTQVVIDEETHPAHAANSINRDSEWGVTEQLPTYFYELPVNLSSEFSEKPDAYKLFEAAKQYLINNSIDQPYANLQVDFATNDPDMEKLYTQAIGGNTIGLYDTCTVNFQEIGLSTVMKVVKTVYDSLLERYEKLEFGTLERTIYTVGRSLNTDTASTEYISVINDDPYVPAVDPDTDEEITPD